MPKVPGVPMAQQQGPQVEDKFLSMAMADYAQQRMNEMTDSEKRAIKNEAYDNQRDLNEQSKPKPHPVDDEENVG